MGSDSDCKTKYERRKLIASNITKSSESPKSRALFDYFGPKIYLWQQVFVDLHDAKERAARLDNPIGDKCQASLQMLARRETSAADRKWWVCSLCFMDQRAGDG
jgi:hypothetical protein